MVDERLDHDDFLCFHFCKCGDYNCFFRESGFYRMMVKLKKHMHSGKILQ